jgi:DNA-directed RNA polymerase specialized sigma24 family protein
MRNKQFNIQLLPQKEKLEFLNDISQDVILKTISHLPCDNRLVLELHFNQNLSRKQIAERLNWSLSKVHNKITRGITLLKRELHPEYFAEMNTLWKKYITESFSNNQAPLCSNCGKPL